MITLDDKYSRLEVRTLGGVDVSFTYNEMKIEKRDGNRRNIIVKANSRGCLKTTELISLSSGPPLTFSTKSAPLTWKKHSKHAQTRKIAEIMSRRIKLLAAYLLWFIVVGRFLLPPIQ